MCIWYTENGFLQIRGEQTGERNRNGWKKQKGQKMDFNTSYHISGRAFLCCDIYEMAADERRERNTVRNG